MAAIVGELSLLNVYTGFTMWAEARSNGTFPGGMIAMACVLVGVPVALVAIILVAMRMYRGRWTERFAWLLVFALLALPWFVLPAKSGYNRTLDGFAQWGSQVKAGPILAWSANATAPTSVPSIPPDWWYLKNRNAPLGVPVAPGAVRSFITGPAPDEVRVLSTSGTVIMAWVHSGSFVRYFVVSTPGAVRPPELDSNLIAWSSIGSGVWTGVQASH